MDDAQLVAAVLAGQASAERELYDRHVDRVFRLAFRMAGDETLARDFTQDTFVRAFGKLADFRGDASLATWLHTVATSVILNGLKNVRRIRAREIDGDELPDVAVTRREAEPDLKLKLARAIDALPEGYRMVFVMHDVEGYTRDEMFAAITAARRAAAAAPARRSSGARITRYAWIGMAAALVLGVAIGRFVLTTQRDAGRATMASHADTNSVSSYAQATTLELARAEALLTTYGAAGANSGVDRQLSAWARDILSNTRLLLDSPAADDPARRKLLQDLELVLVQMVQRSPAAGSAAERSHIDRSLERTQVLSRLRSALPAGRNNGI